MKDNTTKNLQILYQDTLNENWIIQQSTQTGHYLRQDHVSQTYQSSNDNKKISYTTAEANLATSASQTTYLPLGNIINNDYKIIKGNNKRVYHSSRIEKNYHQKKNLNNSTENNVQHRKKNYHQKRNNNEKTSSSFIDPNKITNVNTFQQVNKILITVFPFKRRHSI